MGIKNIIHKNTIAKVNYNKIRSTGVSFDEYCHYIYGKKETGTDITESNLFGKPIKRNNTFWFVQNVLEIFVDEVYKFESEKKDPIILDCGANIGLSILYFKKLFPGSKIIAFEPDLIIYETCKNNLDAFGVKDVELINAAVWNSDGFLKFLPDNSLGGKVIENGQEDSNVKEVKSLRLKKYLNQPIDFLKLDIEGAEHEVLLDCKDDLHLVENLFIEYHSKGNSPQYLHELLQIVSNAGFRYYIKEAWDNMSYPFIDSKKSSSMYFDLQLNIFAYKQHC